MGGRGGATVETGGKGRRSGFGPVLLCFRNLPLFSRQLESSWKRKTSWRKKQTQRHLPTGGGTDAGRRRSDVMTAELNNLNKYIRDVKKKLAPKFRTKDLGKDNIKMSQLQNCKPRTMSQKNAEVMSDFRRYREAVGSLIY